MSERGDISVKAIIGIVILMIVVAAGTSYMFMNFYLNASNDEDDNTEQSKKMGPSYELGEYVVNLSGRGYQVIQAEIVVEINDEGAKKDLEKREPQIRDNVIRILRRQSLEDLQDPEIDALKEELKTSLNERLTEGEITEVWFTRLVAQ
ncbi:MAG: flagellar basal body-associated FliL family protein [Halanaerobiaceae bacterium]